MILAFTKALQDVFAQNDASDNPRDLNRAELEIAAREIEAYLAVSVIAANGVVVKTSTSDLDADLAHDAGTLGIVFLAGQSRIYQKQGASASGSWTFLQSLNLSGTVIAADAWADVSSAGAISDSGANHYNIDNIDSSVTGTYVYTFVNDMPSDFYEIHVQFANADRTYRVTAMDASGFTIGVRNSNSGSAVNADHLVSVRQL